MSQSQVVLLERAKGQYPVSIATSLALESLMNIHPDIQHETPPYGQMNRFWINLRTLHRNVVGACPTDVVSELDPKAVAETMKEEIEYIHQLVSEQSRQVAIQCYFCNYSDLAKRFPLAVLRHDTTAKQKRDTASMLLAVEHLLKLVEPYQVKDHELVRLYEQKIRSPYQGKALTVFFTHCAIDLLEARQFGECYLIESYTGAYKPRSRWYTKFLNGKDLPMIPFQPVFLQLFGDTVHFSPHDKKSRERIIEVAEKYRWSPTSTDALIRYSLEQLKDEYLKEVVLSMLNHVVPGGSM